VRSKSDLLYEVESIRDESVYYAEEQTKLQRLMVELLIDIREALVRSEKSEVGSET
jgi:hypothetical protein